MFVRFLLNPPPTKKNGETYLPWICQMFESKWLAIHPPMVMVINITIDISQIMCF